MTEVRHDDHGSRTRAAAVLIAAACLFAVFVALGVLVTLRWAPLLQLDQATEVAAHSPVVAHPGLLRATLLTTNVGGHLSVDVLTGAAAVALLFCRRVPAAVYLVLARAVELGVETAVKYLIARPRPHLLDPVAHAGGFSFPSGHAGGAAVLCTSVLVLAAPSLRTPRRVSLTIVAALAVTAVAASRVLLGVHYPSDVLGGALLGMAAAFGVAWALNVAPLRRTVSRAGAPSDPTRASQHPR